MMNSYILYAIKSFVSGNAHCLPYLLGIFKKQISPESKVHIYLLAVWFPPDHFNVSK